jgi:hypothetical protein
MSSPAVVNPAMNAASVQPGDQSSSDDKLSPTEFRSIIVTISIGAGLVVLASLSAHYASLSPPNGWVIWLSVSVGGLGGLVHELAQSGGKILFFERKLDGIYIGSVAGVALGAVAGLLAIQSFITHPAAQQATAANAAAQPDPLQLIFEAFLAGLALKGVTEAAGGQALPTGSSSVTPGQALAAEASLNKLASEQPGQKQPDLSNHFPPPPPVLPPNL